jgi:hypothetical protein
VKELEKIARIPLTRYPESVSLTKGKEDSRMDFLLKIKHIFKGEGGLDLQQAIQEKRFFPRMRCAVDARCINEKNQKFIVVVVELSLYGMRIHSEKKFRTGEIIEIGALQGPEGSAETGYSLKMKVVWCRKKQSSKDYIAGLLYEDTRKNLQFSWIALLLKKYGVTVGLSPQKRRKIRVPAHIPLSISIALQTIEGKIEDIGIGGMLITTDKQINIKDTLRFRIGPFRELGHLFCNGKVVHVRFVQASEKWVYGIIFQEMNDRQSILLSEYLKLLIMEQKE